MADIFKNSVGVKIELTLNSDITGYSSVKFLITKPNGVRISPDPTPTVDDAVKGILSYSTVSGDLDTIGTYSVQAQVNFTVPAKTYFSEIVTFVSETGL